MQASLIDILTTMQTYVHATEKLQDSAVLPFEEEDDKKNLSTALKNGGQMVDKSILADTINSIIVPMIDKNDNILYYFRCKVTNVSTWVKTPKGLILSEEWGV